MRIKYGFLKTAIFILLIILLGSGTVQVFAAENAGQKTLKILVIEINPYLETKGMKVTEFLNTFGDSQSLETSIQEMKNDIEFTSGNVIKCNVVRKEYLNEFPKYTNEFTLSHMDYATGKRVYNGKGYQLDELTYLDLFGKGWYGWWDTDNPVISEGMDSFPCVFDYDYLIDKFNLVERKNNNEFDMVWIFSIDPASMGETSMVGRNAFWVNGGVIQRDCDNFIMCGFALSRRDTALESIGHLAESMLNYVYQVSDDAYNSKLKFSNIEELNTWQRFYLCKNNAPAGWTDYGVGQVHFAPNSERDYDITNTTAVQSTWMDWKYNYPDLTGTTTTFTSAVYLDGITPENRAHKRWWFSSMPHYSGRDTNGYSQNWWDYIISTDYVDHIETYDSYKEAQLDDYYGNIILEKGDSISNLKFKLIYLSGKEVDFAINKDYNFVSIDNKQVIDMIDGKITAVSEGEANLIFKYDGREASYKFTVAEDIKSLYFDSIKITPKSKTLYYNGTSDKTTAITVTVPESIKYSVTYSSSNKSVATVSEAGKVNAVGKGSVYITAHVTIEDTSRDYKIRIVSKQASIKITSTKFLFKAGDQYKFKASLYGLSGNVTWSVSDAGVIWVDSKTGDFYARKAGTAYVIVKTGKFVSKIKVTVK